MAAPLRSQTIAGKASRHENRRQQETRHAEAQRHDVPRVQAGRNGQPRDNAPARPDRYCSEAEYGPFQISRVAGCGTSRLARAEALVHSYRGAAHGIPNDVPPTLFGTPDPGTRRNPTRS